MPDRKRVRPISAPTAAGPPTVNRAGGLGSVSKDLTPLQAARRTVQHSIPRVNDINGLFIATGRRELRFNWRNPFAIPFVMLIVVLSPLLLLVAGFYRVHDLWAAWNHAQDQRER